MDSVHLQVWDRPVDVVTDDSAENSYQPRIEPRTRQPRKRSAFTYADTFRGAQPIKQGARTKQSRRGTSRTCPRRAPPIRRISPRLFRVPALPSQRG